MFRNGIDKFEIFSFKLEPSEAKEFNKKVPKQKRSEILRELVKAFNKGDIKITKHITVEAG